MRMVSGDERMRLRVQERKTVMDAHVAVGGLVGAALVAAVVTLGVLQKRVVLFPPEPIPCPPCHHLCPDQA